MTQERPLRLDRSARYFELFVEPNFRAYIEAENRVSEAFREINADRLEAANRWALAAGMSAAVPAYHLSDQLWNECPALMGEDIPTRQKRLQLGEFRRRLQERYCRMLRQPDNPVADLDLLGAVVDAYKHTDLDNKARPVTNNRSTMVTMTVYGQLSFGEGKYGGVDQVIVRLNSGVDRALSSILQNVVDMWRSVLGQPLGDFGQ